jgi:3-oxoacyl-[acyl-carrier protein] reductase
MDAGLTNRVVLVTGGSGGIGQEVIRAFRREGARVVLHYHTHEERAQALAAEPGPAGAALGADLTNEEAVQRLFRAGEDALGPIEILVANAGRWPADDVPVSQMALEQWNDTLATNLTSVFLCMREFFRGIISHRLTDPAAVLIGSTAGLIGEAGHADYAASKAALTYGLARSLKNEMCRIAPRGRVNVVCPGWTFTPMTRRFADDPQRVRRVLQTIALRKVGRPHDMAMAILFLASSRLSGHMSGEILTVSGGMEGRVLYQQDEIDPNQA